MKLTSSQIDLALKELPLWKQQDGTIKRTFTFTDFPQAIEFVKEVAYVAEARGHHPDIDIRWNKVTLGLSTHDVGGVSAKDFSLAKEIEAATA
jgi:4a-hydroxytetrahydrobiopterin dehydratase